MKSRRTVSFHQSFSLNRFLVLLFFVILIFFSSSSSALELEDVLKQVKVTPPDRVAFREERFNSLLKEPMILTGILEYPKTGQLVKIVETPFRESMQVDGDQVEISRDGKKRRLSLKNRNPIKVMLQSIESILSGQADAIADHFKTELTGSNENWQLQLTPRSSRLAAHLESITVEGDCDFIKSILFRMSNGEWQRMEIVPPSPES